MKTTSNNIQFNEQELNDLRLLLNRKIEGHTVTDIITKIIPYEVSDPEGAASMNEVSQRLDGDGASLDFEELPDTKIPTKKYKQLYEMLNTIEDISQCGKISGHSAIIVERSLEKARTTLLKISSALGTQYAEYADNARLKEINKEVNQEVSMKSMRQHPETQTEQHFEYLIRSKSEMRNHLLNETLKNLNACHHMVAAVDTLREMVHHHRPLPGISPISL